MEVPNFQVIEQKIFAQDEQISYDDARKRADDKRLSAFSIFTKIFSRPDVNEIVLSYSEKRYEPFWYVLCDTHLEYTRSRVIEFGVDNVVKHITINGVRQDKPNDLTKLSLEGIEYCVIIGRVRGSMLHLRLTVLQERLSPAVGDKAEAEGILKRRGPV